jgi:hypothetical protein
VCPSAVPGPINESDLSLEERFGRFAMASGYLVSYNVVQLLGWVVTAVLLASRASVDALVLTGQAQTAYIQHTTISRPPDAVVQVLQALALAEIVHVVLGLSSGSLSATLGQGVVCCA